MNKRADIFTFLQDLQANNSKEWMDANRERYEHCKSIIEEIFEPILEDIKSVDPRIITPNARKGLNRINNNLMFHPDRPTYKDHFGIGFGYGKGLGDFYIHLGIDELLIAGGLWHPPVDKLKRLRSEIDYEGDRLQTILSNEAFKAQFQLFTEDRLTNAPKGYDKSHPHIELLKMKSLGAFRTFSRNDFYKSEFGDLVVESYQMLMPMLDFVNTAIADD